jgi:hypothetical protein
MTTCENTDKDWITTKKEFTKQFDDLNDRGKYNVTTWVTEMNQAIDRYVTNAGLSQDPNQNPQYQIIQENLRKINDLKKRYNDLNDCIQKYLTKKASDTKWNKKLIENGTMQTEINTLEKIQKEMKVDVDSALARDELLRTRNTNVTKHDLFLFDHAIPRSLVPYLWVVSVLFVGAAIILFRITFQTLNPSVGSVYDPATMSTLGLIGLTIYDFFSNRIILMSLFASACIVILFLSLKVAGII